jgi:hypothetical protein
MPAAPMPAAPCVAATSVAAEAAAPRETVSTEPSDAMSDMSPEIVTIVPVAEIPDMVEEIGTAKAEIERTIRVFGVPVIGAGVAV